jgi:hypothetical protein
MVFELVFMARMDSMERMAEGGSGIDRRDPAAPEHRIVSRMALKSNDSPKLRGFESDLGLLCGFFASGSLPLFFWRGSVGFSRSSRDAPLSSTCPGISAADSAGLGSSGELGFFRHTVLLQTLLI